MPDVYPTPVWPSDVTVNATDSAVDEATGLANVGEGTHPGSTVDLKTALNRQFYRQAEVVRITAELRLVRDGTLSVGVYPGDYTLGGAHKHFAGAVLHPLQHGA